MLKKFQKLTLFLLSLFIPISTLAYSSKIVVGGDTVGIKLNTEGILVVGSYDINGHNTLIESGLKNGDIISQINNKKVNKVEEMVDIIKECNCDNLNINYKRGKELKKTNLPLYESGNSKKTGLYVKDSISGIGTLTYIDPETKLFGVLGHEIIDSTTGEIIDIDSGTIFNSKVTGITKSERGVPGEKNAILYNEKVDGNILENTNKGLFGKYTSNIDTSKLYTVDIICHGTPSPRLWHEYLEWMKHKYGNDISEVNFRDKRYGWKAHLETVRIGDILHTTSNYRVLFLKNAFLRPSCYECPFSSLKRRSDITIGDAWGIEETHSLLNDNKGCSIVLINSDKGQELFNLCRPDVTVEHVNLEDYLQPNLYKPSVRPKDRQKYWEYLNTKGFDELVKHYGRSGMLRRIRDRRLVLSVNRH